MKLFTITLAVATFAGFNSNLFADTEVVKGALSPTSVASNPDKDVLRTLVFSTTDKDADLTELSVSDVKIKDADDNEMTVVSVAEKCYKKSCSFTVKVPKSDEGRWTVQVLGDTGKSATLLVKSQETAQTDAVAYGARNAAASASKTATAATAAAAAAKNEATAAAAANAKTDAKINDLIKVMMGDKAGVIGGEIGSLRAGVANLKAKVLTLDEIKALCAGSGQSACSEFFAQYAPKGVTDDHINGLVLRALSDPDIYKKLMAACSNCSGPEQLTGIAGGVAAALSGLEAHMYPKGQVAQKLEQDVKDTTGKRVKDKEVAKVVVSSKILELLEIGEAKRNKGSK